MVIQFLFNNTAIRLNQRKPLKKFIVKLFLLEEKALQSLHFIFCNDEYLLGINREFLNHDYYTDIITFRLSEPSKPIEGEIYISTDRVKNNAESLRTPLNTELHRIIFHGALHLCGYRDKSSADKKEMTAMEDHYLKLYFNN